MVEPQATSRFDRRLFLVTSAICLALPCLAGVLFGSGKGLESYEFNIAVFLAIGSTIVWGAGLVLGVVLLCLKRIRPGLTTLLGVLVGALVGFGGCLGIATLLDRL